MARKKRRTGVGGPRAVPEDPDFDIVDRDEAGQPDLTEAQRKREASREARAARSRDNTFHARKAKLAHLIDHLPQALWDAFLDKAVRPRVKDISERGVIGSLLLGFLVRDLFTLHVAGRSMGAVNPLAHLHAEWLGVDPGKTNMATVAHEERSADGSVVSVRHWTLTSGPGDQDVSRVSSKPSSLASYRRFADTVLETYDAMWAEVSKKRWANAKFRLYCGKQRVVASFWAKVNKEAKKLWPDRILALAYGAAGFNGSGTIGCRGVPVSQMRKEAVKQFRPERVVLVDEFRTSRVSSADNTPSETLLDTPPESFRWLRPVKSMAKRSQVRGLMCSTSINNITRFYDRDVSAALNIRRCAVGPGPRPTELCYWTNRPAMPKPGQPGQDWVEIPDKPLLRKWQRQLQQ
ncbi:hypothetical protein QJQ45_001768 [Haematococcus lacustris]|nr:hypothetical protein QJQ45_001768 [Haematococcus lacustris]